MVVLILKIDQEFKNLIPPLTHDERKLLEQNIIKEGCRDPIVVWDGTIIDGHNRYDICTANDLEYKTAEVQLSNRNEAINWIIDNQLGKRNVSEKIKEYLIGKRYQSEKNTHGGDRKSEESKAKDLPLISTAQKIAEQNKVSHQTVKNNEKFAESIDKIAESSGKSAMDILTTAKVTQEDAKRVSTLAPEVQKEIVEKVTNKEVKSFKEALKSIPELELEPTQNQFDEFEPEEIIHESVIQPCDIFIPTKQDVFICPCGCGYGFCAVNEKWYSSKEIINLKET